MSNNKQTAVEWLVNELFWPDQQEKLEKYIEKAKEMEKQQIVDATCLNKYVNEDDREIGEQYYKEEYGKQ